MKLKYLILVAVMFSANAFACKTVPVITGEFATEHEAIDANKTQINYEIVCHTPVPDTTEFKVSEK